MNVSITFLGGSGTVTGSKYLVRHNGKSLLVDCGLFQGYKQLRLRNWQPLSVAPQQIDAVVLTGYQLGLGGVALLLFGYGLGGELHGFGVKSVGLLVYLVILSSAAFSLWTTLLKYNRVSMITVFNFMVPIFGTLLSALFLNESFLEWKNALALVLVCVGIWLVTKEEKPAQPVVTGTVRE